MYSFSGNATHPIRSINLATHAVTSIAVSGGSYGEIFGAAWDATGEQFLAVDIISRAGVAGG